MQKVVAFFRREAVLCIVLLLAAVSCCFVKPSYDYLNYIDFRTLAILFCLMCVVAGLKEIGIFDRIAHKLLHFVRGSRQLLLLIVFLCFFFSMIITNDVALITFVPFTIIVWKRLPGKEMDKLLLPTVVLETVAANLGSMLTPIGNPQNLYLYGKADISFGAFIKTMLPYTGLALAMLSIFCVCRKNFRFDMGQNEALKSKASLQGKRILLIGYLVLFILCFLTVVRILPYIAVLAVVIVAIAVLNGHIFKRVDYSLLLTFAGLFIFIGNMGNIPSFRNFLAHILEGREVITAIIASQVISNVPAALLLSGFTANYTALLIGTNLGGLGTLIASMASLISYKYIAAERPGKKGAYLVRFTVINLVFLVILFLFYMLIK